MKLTLLRLEAPECIQHFFRKFTIIYGSVMVARNAKMLAKGFQTVVGQARHNGFGKLLRIKIGVIQMFPCFPVNPVIKEVDVKIDIVPYQGIAT